MRTIQNAAAFIFILCVMLLSAVTILGIWEFFDAEVISKSFQTLGLLAFVAVVVIFGGKFIDGQSGMLMPADPIFKTLRHVTLGVLIVAVSLLAIVGVMSIWELLEGELVFKSLSSIGVLAFASFIVVVTCLERENHPMLRQSVGRTFSVGGVVATLIVLWVLAQFAGAIF